MFWLVFLPSTLYYIFDAGLDPLQLVLVGTVLEGSIFLLEVPTGIVADLYGRRLSVIIGIFLIGVGFLVQGIFALFPAILLAQVLWGAGYTFTSGALEAWITDEIGEEAAASAFVRGAKLGQIGTFVGMLLATLLGTITLRLPLLLGAGAFLVFGFYLLLVMPEVGFKPPPAEERSNWARVVQTTQTGLGMVRRRPVLRIIVAIGFLYGLYSEGFDRLFEAHLLDQFSFPFVEPIVWFGVMGAISMLVSAGILNLIEKRVDPASMRINVRLQTGISMLLVLSLFGFSWAGALPLAILFYWIVTALREAHYPFYLAWINHKLEPQVRATVLSMSSLFDALGQISGGPLLGVVAREVSIRAGLTVSAILLSPVLGLYAGILRVPDEDQE